MTPGRWKMIPSFSALSKEDSEKSFSTIRSGIEKDYLEAQSYTGLNEF
jgi:hypothetical protein